LQAFGLGLGICLVKMKIKDLPISDITLRKYEKPFNLNNREVIKKLCLSLGLLQPGDSRDVVVDIFFALIKAKHAIDCKEIEERAAWFRQENKLEVKGVTPANIRRQLRRLKELMIIDKKGRLYFLNENESLKNIFEEKIKKLHINPITERIKEYCEHIDKMRGE